MMSTSAICSANRIGSWKGRIAAARPIRIRDVREATAQASVAGSTESP